MTENVTEKELQRLQKLLAKNPGLASMLRQQQADGEKESPPPSQPELLEKAGSQTEPPKETEKSEEGDKTPGIASGISADKAPADKEDDAQKESYCECHCLSWFFDDM